MAIFTDIDEVSEADIIIAGGGTAGCIIAARLAMADASLTILLVEAGRNNYADPTITNPAVFLAHLRPDSKTVTFHKGRRTQALANREPIVPAGNILGGGSSVNFMMYCRAQGSDFDSWKTEGWSQKELLFFMKKLENYQGPDSKEVHGHHGPIHISESPYDVSVFESEFLLAAEQQGYPKILDLQDLTSNNGFSRWRKTISRDGRRQDTAHQYLHPLLQDGEHPNLHVLVQTKITRVLFDENKRASAVECVANETFTGGLSLNQSTTKCIQARKMIIICSGSLGTPTILERSGVGKPYILEKFDIPVVSSLPGVGENYQDHQLVQVAYNLQLKAEVKDKSVPSEDVNLTGELENKDIRPGWSGVDLSSKLRPTTAEVEQLGPEFEAMWNKEFKNAPERPLVVMGIAARFMGDPSTVPEGQYATVAMYTAYPQSRGSIHITGTTLSDVPDFNTGFLSDAHDIDLRTQLWAYKKQREIMRRTTACKGELAQRHPKFPEGSKAALLSLNRSQQKQSSPWLSPSTLTYSQDDNEAIVQFIRENVNTTWHGLGTAKMAPRENGGVVDKSLNVYGVIGLKCADTSIAPENVGANTGNTAMTIGEKAASIIAAELGLVL